MSGRGLDFFENWIQQNVTDMLILLFVFIDNTRKIIVMPLDFNRENLALEQFV